MGKKFNGSTECKTHQRHLSIHEQPHAVISQYQGPILNGSLLRSLSQYPLTSPSRWKSIEAPFPACVFHIQSHTRLPPSPLLAKVALPTIFESRQTSTRCYKGPVRECVPSSSPSPSCSARPCRSSPTHPQCLDPKHQYTHATSSTRYSSVANPSSASSRASAPAPASTATRGPVQRGDRGRARWGLNLRAVGKWCVCPLSCQCDASSVGCYRFCSSLVACTVERLESLTLCLALCRPC